MNADAALPRLLLLEDDAVSAAFLVAVLEALPARVDVAASLAEAEPLRDAGHVLWLFDANLPDGTGGELLARWRARGLATPALAHTADARREELDALIAAGFVDVMLKPLSVAQLQDAVRRALAGVETCGAPKHGVQQEDATCAASPIWDDAAALRALNGNASIVAAMRDLFLGELPAVRRRIADAFARADADAVGAELHKLQASCGFVGAARVLAAVMALREAPTSCEAFARFEDAVEGTLPAKMHPMGGARPRSIPMT
jgi:CheY-like chemotaxis protein/HPt (histidine-containing phosphotransfer) domain-containing protein